MPVYFDSHKQPYTLTKRLGSGGEGAVYACEGRDDVVAKIYHEAVPEEKMLKLVWMAENQEPRLLKVAAWVTDVLYDTPDGSVVGFLMPGIRAKEIHELYSLKSRRIYFPEATWHFLIHASANLARAFHSLHKNSHVMGDVNHGNCVVLADGTVKLIDCDSYAIQTDRGRYPCDVGVTTHLAPELQGKSLRGVEREEKHDNFGLAVIIFQLLFLGRHPFSGNFLGGDDKSLEDAIKEHLFAYGKYARVNLVEQPPGTLPLSALPPNLAELFERAFSTDDDRPEPWMWIEALEDLKENLEQCTLHPGHLYCNRLAACPWCVIEGETGVVVFPFVVGALPGEQAEFDVVTVENLVESFTAGTNPLRLADNIPAPVAAPTPEVVVGRRMARKQKALLCAGYLVGLTLLYLVLGGVCGFIIGLVAVGLAFTSMRQIGRINSSEILERYNTQRTKWFDFEKQWNDALAAPVLARDLAQIKERIGVYRTLHNVDNDPDADFSGVGETKERLEHEINGLVYAVRAGTVRLQKKQQHLIAKSKRLASDLTQSQADMRYLGTNIPVGVFYLVITILVPIFTTLIPAGWSNPGLMRTPPSDRGYPVKMEKTPVSKATIETNVPNVPEFTITDKEINALEAPERDSIIKQLIDSGDRFVQAKDYKHAEEQFKFALRFDKQRPATLDKLGTFYYDREKFDDALRYYERSEAIKDSDSTMFQIGGCHISLGNFAAARDVFLRLTSGTRKSNPTFYNLGASYVGLKDYRAALDAYRQALVFDPNDNDSIYQVGICLFNLGDKDGVREQYKILVERGSVRASAFKKAVGRSVNLDMPPDVNYRTGSYRRADSVKTSGAGTGPGDGAGTGR